MNIFNKSSGNMYQDSMQRMMHCTVAAHDPQTCCSVQTHSKRKLSVRLYPSLLNRCPAATLPIIALQDIFAKYLFDCGVNTFHLSGKNRSLFLLT